jgi:hypothetical protein
MKKNIVICLTLLTIVASAEAAFAGSLIYHGNNPDISASANPYNSAAIGTSAAQTRPHAPASKSYTQTDAELVRTSVLSSISSSITQKLVGNTVGSGTANFGDGSYATWTTGMVDGVNTRTIVTHNLDGSSTTISFPL